MTQYEPKPDHHFFTDEAGKWHCRCPQEQEHVLRMAHNGVAALVEVHGLIGSGYDHFMDGHDEKIDGCPQCENRDLPPVAEEILSGSGNLMALPVSDCDCAGLRPRYN